MFTLRIWTFQLKGLTWTWFYMCQVGLCTPAVDTVGKIMVRINLHWILLLVWLQNWYLQEGNSSAGGGRSFVASSSISLLPPPQEALQWETTQRKYYSGRWATMTCTSQCFTELLLFLCVHQYQPASSPWDQRLGLGILTESVRAFVQETLFSTKYGDDACVSEVTRTPQSWTNAEIRSVKRYEQHRPLQTAECTTQHSSATWGFNHFCFILEADVLF